jgi:Asp-tRNA(Asn)/Glu-tRNA(Gln) amidotransferase A subunit family amidase
MHAYASLTPPFHATVTELEPRLASGSLTAAALVAGCQAQIAAHDRAGAELRALICLNTEAADDARQLDDERRRSGVRGPLHGIPVVLKDNIDLRGYPTTSGSRALARAVALRDAGQTRRLRQAGAVLLAKANLSEFSFEIRSRSSLAGDVRNPFDRHVTAGGSSGGTAAAVAAGFAVAGLGTDTGGSIRVPAAFNGLVGLRPTHGLLDLGGVAPLAPSTDTIGPIGRCVSDVALLLGIMTDAPGALRLPQSLTQRHSLAGARLGVLRQAFGEDPHIRAAMDGALSLMARAGAVLIDPAVLPAEVLPIERPLIVDFEFRRAFDAYLRDNFAGGTAPASLAQLYSSGEFLPEYRDSLGKRLRMSSLESQAYRDVRAYHQSLRNELAALMTRHSLDAIVYPTSRVLPTSLDNPAVGWAPELAACSGWPALTLPVGQSPRGLPIGLELLGRAHSEATLLGLAHDLECLGPGRAIPSLPLSAPAEG